jgi:hypothetical protein
MPKEFACPNCDSPSVVYTDTEEGDGQMVCRRRSAWSISEAGGIAPRLFGGSYQWVLAGYVRDVRRIHPADC